ncbi:tubulin-like doman-containing protein [Thomasclavelia cocleata]|uniref:tubulin-like doman-containing protein n=2 Tax=Thomasclavelia cocleata TaxID=69824 RepID=UPI00255B2CB5|nr:tubulin-like doman-containing protein [Thomasclavelia cocleata]
MNSPTLLIGIGGAGGEILLELSKRVSSKERKNIGFLTIDTDVNSLKKLKDEGYNGEIIVTSTNTTVGYTLSKNVHARDNWFPINSILNRKTLTEGAGQVRAISRLAFDSLISSGRIRPLYEIIEKLYSTNGGNFGQSLRVMIVGSLAGGTGSGILLYLGMHIRDYIKNHYSTDAVIIKGFFLTAEIFKSNLEKEKELTSLMANSYATIKELNAFFMKADNLLPNKYSTLSFDGLEYETKNIKKYDSLPYDFCFIYDFHSISDENLGKKRSYIVHAANCIYALAISPINLRSNSMEDNEIISLVNNDGRSRYCGAGEAELFFPIDDIIDYLTLKLKNIHLSNQWLKYDKIYLKKKKEIKENVEKGMIPIELTRDKSYIDSVNQLAENKDAFSNRIKIENTYLEISDSSTKLKYNVYLDELEKYVKKHIENDQNWKKKIGKLEKRENDFLNINEESSKENCQHIQKGINNHIKGISKYLISSSLENDSKEKALNFFLGTSSHLQKNNLNYWIQNDMHPNSVRYFLYSLREEILEKKNKTNTKTNSLKNDLFKNVEKKLWRDNSEGAVGNHSNYIAAYPVIKERWGLKNIIYKKNKGSYRDKIEAFKRDAQEFRENTALLAFYDECLKQVDILCKHLENFYKNLENSVQKLQYDFEKYENRYSIEPIGRTRYICCDKQCLDYFSKKVDDYSTFYEIPSELSKTIITGIINMNETDDIQVLNDIYETEIPKFYKEYIKDNHSSIANMTILDALELEARIKLDFPTDRNDIEKYVLEVIENGYRLAEPFISCKHDAKNRTIVACTYNKKLFEDSKIREFEYIHDKLEKYNKIDDDNYIMNSIMFYRAIYGLRADELTKFQPLEITPTYIEPDGLYYKAYNSIIRDIGSGTGEKYYNNKTITPHIHYNWHLITMLPELTENDQIKIETKICRSLIYGLLIKKIKYHENRDGTYSYVYNKAEQIKQLITSFNKKSESFYELIDALSCDIKLQDEIISEVEDIIKNGVSQYHKLEKSRIYKLIEGLELDKNEIKDIDSSENISLFTFAILYYITCPNNLYNEEWFKYLIDETIYFFDFLIEQFVDISEKAEEIEVLFKKQWEIFNENYNCLKGKYEYLKDNHIGNIKKQIESYFRKKLINKNETEINELIKKVFNI